MRLIYRGRAAALTTALVFSTLLAIGYGEAAPRGAAKEGIDNHQNTVAIVSGTPAGTYLQFAYDLSVVLDDLSGRGLRVLPMLGKGGAQNIRDVLALKGVDMGIAQTTDLARLKAEQPDLVNRLSYIAKLYNEELHLLARPEIRSLGDLAGKAVNFSDLGGGTQFVARELFEKSGVRVREVNMGQADAIEKMKSGEIAATVYVAGKPGPAFARAPRDLGFHFLPVAYSRPFEENYYPAVIEAKDYPGLIPEGQSVETIAVGAVLIAYNWPDKSVRYKRLEAFVDAFFDKIAEFKKAPRHPKWQEVNLAADVSGWQRFAPAARILREAGAYTASTRPAAETAALRSEFERFARERGLSGSAREKIFEDFIRWRESAR
jgi:TRAP transporter TAXI family solute receptor